MFSQDLSDDLGNYMYGGLTNSTIVDSKHDQLGIKNGYNNGEI